MIQEVDLSWVGSFIISEIVFLFNPFLECTQRRGEAAMSDPGSWVGLQNLCPHHEGKRGDNLWTEIWHLFEQHLVTL